MKVEALTVACRICGDQTRMLGTRLCDPCFELKRRIVFRPNIARKILALVEAKGVDA